ncbi:elongation factor P maturation arginine rhamnosyltransferase EarP [Caenimonas koreensis DSM 17982]|uniref:Protein-arginine rhamnosyltransferase n=1 Tax=Caenimonas koreensis DSM 17982 TaxID=1121255 RepID=A0A844AUE4_9BURK|nr:elongation factor P maturation arginine rhamnosyltransferase EarP [Caenimonas koreensis]MRD45988.1 elongation factor P maturation arginine rhamnosyltransferase EarP [Caenimonas koreensis DSM 17982]
MVWDIFCKVIDNHGDIGVCWRLATQLAGRGESARVWVDDPSALAWMAPSGHERVEVIAWTDEPAVALAPGDVVIEAFGCELPQHFQEQMAQRATRPVWINLEYLTAESFAERNHTLASPVLTGPAAGATKFFFYPGFTGGTGGLLRETRLDDAQHAFDADAWLRAQGIERGDSMVVSLFCYEPAAMCQLLAQLASGPRQVALLVADGRPAAAIHQAIAALDEATPGWNSRHHLAVKLLPLLTQPDFDHLLWSCDLNFVRGEDSLVRALWAGRPFIWHIYPQHDDAHHTKLLAFLDWIEAPASLREFHLAWNGMNNALPAIDMASWAACAAHARNRLLAQDDLVTNLMRFVRQKGMHA